MGMFRPVSGTNMDVNADIKLQEIMTMELAKGNSTLSDRRSVWIYLRNIGILASEYGSFFYNNQKY